MLKYPTENRLKKKLKRKKIKCNREHIIPFQKEKEKTNWLFAINKFFDKKLIIKCGMYLK